MTASEVMARIDTRDWPVRTWDSYPTNALHRTLWCNIKVKEVPKEIREQLLHRDPGLASLLDGNDEEEIVLGEARIIGTYMHGDNVKERYGIASLTVDELAAKIQLSLEPKAIREQKEREASEKEQRLKEAEREADRKKMEDWQRAEEARAEVERRKNPHYRLDLMEQEVAALKAGNAKQ